MAYLLDANVFIQAKNLHYGLDFCPGFWDWLLQKHASNELFSIEKVGDELTAGDDELSNWADERGTTFFLKPDAAILPALGTVSTWATNQQYDSAAVHTLSAKGRLLPRIICFGTWTHCGYPREGRTLNKEN